MLDVQQIQSLKDAFQEIDKDQTGMISLIELQQALMDYGENLNPIEISQIITNLDYAGNGEINYTEFLVATIEIKSVLTYDRLWALFKYFDTDSSGYITPANMKEAFAKTGKTLTESDIKQILEKHDIERNGVISFDEFRLILFYGEKQKYSPRTKSNK